MKIEKIETLSIATFIIALLIITCNLLSTPKNKKSNVKESEKYPNQDLLTASTREAFSIIRADKIGCHIITCTPDLIHKTLLFGKNLQDYSRETVAMFYNDAKEAAYEI